MMHEALTHKIIGCAMEVHRILGSGFQEVIYQRSLAIEMRLQQLDFVRELSMTVSYKSKEVGIRRVDFFVADTIMVEMKAVAHLNETIWHKL